MNRNRGDEANKEYTERYLSALHPDNLAVARRLLVRRTNGNNEWTSNRTWAHVLKSMDALVGNRPFVSVSADEWAHAIQEALTDVARTTMSTRVSYVKEFLRKALVCKDLPVDLEDALSVAVDEEEVRQARVMPEDEKRMLLEHIVDHPARYDSSRTITQKVALVWYYEDTGYRCDEGRSLSVDAWENGRRPDGGIMLALPSRKQAIARGCRLKRGPREIKVYKCAKAVQAWLEEHPAGSDPTAPLFTGFYDKTGHDRLSKQVLNNWIRRLGIEAGLQPIEGRASPLTPHDFRHTRITQAAKQRPFNFMEFSMYFWGIPNSKEAATYVHLKGDDLGEVARSNLGIDRYGYNLPRIASAARA
jgi:integrase